MKANGPSVPLYSLTSVIKFNRNQRCRSVEMDMAHKF